jgi:beta-lactamase class A
MERAVTLSENSQASLTVVDVVERVTAGIGMPEGGPISADLLAALMSAHEQGLETLVAPCRERVEIQTRVMNTPSHCINLLAEYKTKHVNILIRLLLVTGMTVNAAAASVALPPLPLQVPEQQWQPLLDRVDPRLQRQLERGLRTQAGWSTLVKRRKFSVALVDLSQPERPRFAQVNGNIMMYAASLPKIAILLAAVDALESGRLQLDAELDKDLRDMIRTSSNSAATRTIDRLGGLERVNEVMVARRFEFYDPHLGGGLWVGRRYEKTSRRLPDPVYGISHGATATQVARFFYRLATGHLINTRASQRMLDYLVDPGLSHKFVKPLRQQAPQARLYRKSGTWLDWHSDAVLVWGPVWRRYILVGMVEDPDGEAILQSLVAVAEGALQNAFPPRID